MTRRAILPMPPGPPESYESRLNAQLNKEIGGIKDDLQRVGWEDVLSDIGAGRGVGVNAPTWTLFRNGIYGYAFSNTAMNEVWVSIHVTHNWRIGSKYYPHLHWALNVAGTAGQKVHWGIEYTVAKGHNQAAFPATTTITFEPTVSETQYQHMITECTDAQAITIEEVDSVILMRVYRDPIQAADNVANVAFLFFVDCHYQVDRFLGTPQKAPNFYK